VDPSKTVPIPLSISGLEASRIVASAIRQLAVNPSLPITGALLIQSRRLMMDQDTIAFLKDICKKIKEVADLSDHFLALQ